MRYIRLLIAMLILMIVIPLNVHASTFPKLNKDHLYVQDYAKIFSESEISRLNFLSEQLEENTGVEMAVFTVDSAGESRDLYATEVINHYGIGKEDLDNGIVILLNMDKDKKYNNRGIEVRVGYGLEGFFNDAKVGRIIDQSGYETLKEGNYSKGTIEVYDAFYEEINKMFADLPKNATYDEVNDISNYQFVIKQFYKEMYAYNYFIVKPIIVIAYYASITTVLAFLLKHYTNNFHDIFGENTNERRFPILHCILVSFRAGRYIKLKYNNKFVTLLYYVHGAIFLLLEILYLFYLESTNLLKLTSTGIYNETRKDPAYIDDETDKLIRMEKVLPVNTRILDTSAPQFADGSPLGGGSGGGGGSSGGSGGGFGGGSSGGGGAGRSF
ncbi:TPM domain-containing protein [Macrococcus armenti]|uniref:TPM domain-containing protein n=1 Tax=Macrococcus armenti TaxID=2875764 RepID=UPI001CCB9FF7|nr:TPM domain-containing protein [Macrococcus armenti]UBH22620.1 TPM domain-containing protein [Macrococcus armenti]